MDYENDFQQDTNLNSEQEQLNLIEKKAKEIDVIEDVDFDYNGYQVVRGEYFAHLYEPSITFNMGKRLYWGKYC